MDTTIEFTPKNWSRTYIIFPNEATGYTYSTSCLNIVGHNGTVVKCESSSYYWFCYGLIPLLCKVCKVCKNTSGNWGSSDKCLYTFKIDTISTITNRITYHQIKMNINCWPWWISQYLPVLLDHQFWYSMWIVYNQISDHQTLVVELSKTTKISHLALLSPSYISHFSCFILLHILVFLSYLSIFILSYFLVLNHIALNLNNSHNILRKNWEARIMFLYFVQLAGAKKMCGSVCIAVFARLILICHWL